MASPAGDWLGAETDRAGRVVGRARPHACPAIRRSSSSATPPRARGRTAGRCPGVAPVAKQQGRYVARLHRARALAGRDAAAVPLPRLRQPGHDRPQPRRRRVRPAAAHRLPAWLLWSVAHLYFLIGFRNRVVVALSWVWTYLTFQRGARLITGISGARMPAETSDPPAKASAKAA